MTFKLLIVVSEKSDIDTIAEKLAKAFDPLTLRVTMTFATSVDEGSEVFKNMWPDLTLVDIRKDNRFGLGFLKKVHTYVDTDANSRYWSDCYSYGRSRVLLGVPFLMMTDGLEPSWIEEVQKECQMNVEQVPFETGAVSFSELVLSWIYYIVHALHRRLSSRTHRDQPKWRRKPVNEKILEDWKEWESEGSREKRRNYWNKKRTEWFERIVD